MQNDIVIQIPAWALPSAYGTLKLVFASYLQHKYVNTRSFEFTPILFFIKTFLFYPEFILFKLIGNALFLIYHLIIYQKKPEKFFGWLPKEIILPQKINQTTTKQQEDCARFEKYAKLLNTDEGRKALVKAITDPLNKNQFWHTADGRRIAISEMTNNHVKSATNILFRRRNSDEKFALNDKNTCLNLIQEAVQRNIVSQLQANEYYQKETQNKGNRQCESL